MNGPTRYFVGLDLGQPGQPTALAVFGRPTLTAGTRPGTRPTYDLRHLERFPPGTGYPEIVEAVVELLRTQPLPKSWLLADYTGVGRAVLELFRDGLGNGVTCGFSPVVLTAGGPVTTGHAGGFAIPKTDLVGSLQVLLQTRRLRIASDLSEAATLVRELETYRPKVLLVRDDMASWRDTPHDDLVLAAALAAWGGELALRMEARKRVTCSTSYR
jgi:hypothetical protein